MIGQGLPESIQIQSQISKVTLPQKSVKTTKNHTFSPNTVIPITRLIQINQHCYSLYSTLHKIPLAVHQFLDKSIMEGNANREGKDFYQHPCEDQQDQKFFVDIKYYQETSAYKSLSYDKGHMAPAKNYCGDQNSMSLTYDFANCIPQNSYFNRGSWKNLQSYCRNLIRNDICDTIEIISGPVFYSDTPHKTFNNVFQNHQVVMMKNGIIVPPKCYKIIKANSGQKSYVSAFVMKNDKVIDNQLLLKSFEVKIQDLQSMTGLRFKLGAYSSLQQLDPAGVNKTMGQLHLQFYNKLFKLAKSLAQMNGARKQGFMYQTKLDPNIIPTEQKIKMGLNDLNNIITQNGWVRTKAKCRRKVNTLLALHRDAKQLNALDQQFQKKISQNILANLQGCKTQDDRQYHKLISSKIYSKNYGYVYPYENQLKDIFPKYQQKQKSKQSPTKQQEQQIDQTSNSTTVTVKKKYAAKKDQNIQKIEDEQTQKYKKPKPAAKKQKHQVKIQLKVQLKSETNQQGAHQNKDNEKDQNNQDVQVLTQQLNLMKIEESNNKAKDQ